MKIELGKRAVLTDQTTLDIEEADYENTPQFERNHEMMQAIEDYFKGYFGEGIDLSQMHFYDGNPKENGKEISPSDAIDLLNDGFPILANCGKAHAELLAFKKDGNKLLTGEDIKAGPEYENIIRGIDLNDFRKEIEPPKPGFWANLFSKIGIKTASYRRYHDYQDKKARVDEYDKQRSVYDIAKVTEEDPDFVKDFEKTTKGRLNSIKIKQTKEKTKKVEAKAAEKVAEKVAENKQPSVDISDNLQIGDNLASSDPKPTEKKAKADLPEDQAEFVKEFSNNQKNIREMRESGFLTAVNRIMLNGGSDEQILQQMERERFIYLVPNHLTNEMFLDLAKRDLEVNRAVEASNLANDDFLKAREKYHTLSAEEYNGLSAEEKQLFEMKFDGTYQDKIYVKDSRISQDLKDRKAAGEKAPKKEDKGEGAPTFAETTLTEREHQEAIAEAEQVKKADAVLKRIEAKRLNAMKDEIAKSIIDSIPEDQKPSDPKQALGLVRLGDTLASMTKTFGETEQLYEMSKEDPEALYNLYGKTAEKNLSKPELNQPQQEAPVIKNPEIKSPVLGSVGPNMN